MQWAVNEKEYWKWEIKMDEVVSSKTKTDLDI